MIADKKLQADLRKLRDLGTQLAVKGNELMKLGVEVQRLADGVTPQIVVPGTVLITEELLASLKERALKYDDLCK